MRSGYIVLVLALLLAVWRSQPPLPAGVDAPATAFSAARAFTDVSAIAEKPHPVGSAEHARVRGYIFGRMTELGLSPQLQATSSTAAFADRIVSAPVVNVFGVLKGKDPAKPALLVMSHYDTVPDSPGAGDDTAGVAATLEIARALKASGQPERDVIFLVTDGEELGLMGAAAFFHRHPLAAHVGAVINFETRGDSGLANMFETGPGNGAAVALYAARVSRPAANSLSRAIYRAMPNGSDLSVALEKGLPALNFAFIGDEAAYHSALATPAHLNRGSLQHMGDQALGAARAFAADLPARTADSGYADVLGFFLIQYPLWFGWVVLAVAAVLTLYGIYAAPKPAGWGRGIVAAVLIAGVPLAALIGLGFAFGGVPHFLRLSHFDFLLGGAGTLAIGLALTVVALFARRPTALWQVLLLALLIAGAVLQVLVPEAAFALVWPALCAALMAALRYGLFRDGVVARVLVPLLALASLAMTASEAVAMFTALGVDLPAVLILPLLAGLPVFLLLPQRRPRLLLPVILAIGGAGLFAFGRFAAPTPSHPAPATVRYVKDLDSGKAWRVAYLGGRDRYTAAALGAPVQAVLPWSAGRRLWAAEAPSVTVPDTDVVIVKDGNVLRIVAQPRPGAWSATIVVAAEAGFAAASFDGMTLPPSGYREFRLYAPDRGGFAWTVPAPKRGKVTVKVTTLYPAWPAEAAPLPSLPPERMAFGNHAATETIKTRTWMP
jgi:hypothetical protein